MCPKIVDKKERRHKILLAAMHAAAEKGIKNVKIDEIAKAAHIGKGTIYEYFQSKEEIFGAAIIEFMQQFEDLLAKKMLRAVTPQEKLKAIIYSSIEVSEHEDPELMNLLIDVWAEAIRQDNEELNKVFNMKEIYCEYRKIVASIFSDGIKSGIFRKIDIETVTSIFLAVLDGLMIQWLIDKENVNLKKSAEVLYDTFMKGISIK